MLPAGRRTMTSTPQQPQIFSLPSASSRARRGAAVRLRPDRLARHALGSHPSGVEPAGPLLLLLSLVSALLLRKAKDKAGRRMCAQHSCGGDAVRRSAKRDVLATSSRGSGGLLERKSHLEEGLGDSGFEHVRSSRPKVGGSVPSARARDGGQRSGSDASGFPIGFTR